MYNLLAFVLVAFALSFISAQTTHAVNVAPNGDRVFSPATVNIKAGDSVKWIWQDDGHTVTQTTGSGCTSLAFGWDTGYQDSGFTFALTFNGSSPTIYYKCSPHCSGGMKGVINVSP
eukprot:TRINITY_DN917_c0_g1_i2.p1 TRINITY_DN917_c0_g1~~TRINITY_DN917_c0_g1_i2.p1  ORF type:complete len:117 (+),score=26.69 TRINITY_DN917_c0_g1_i2:61-411(+)